MVQIINDPFSGNIFGRLGKGIGQGLSQQLPQEIERGRLKSGLKKLNEKKDLDPMEYFTEALSIPGLTPQATETLGKLAKQRLQAQALSKSGEMDKRFDKYPVFEEQNNDGQADQGIPSLTTRNPIEATLNPTLPKSQIELDKRAAERYNANPARYNYDPDSALEVTKDEDAREIARNKVLQDQRINEQNVQKTVTDTLRNQHNLLQNNVPAEVYSNLEDEAIQAVKSVKDGGKGWTEQRAAKEIGEKLSDISKDYANLAALGGKELLGKNAKETVRALKSLQSKFAKRDELDHFANTLVAQNGLSPEFAYSRAYPLEQDKVAYDIIAKAPTQSKFEYKGSPEYKRKIENETLKLAPSLAKNLRERNGSPLTIAYALRSKGYDPATWMDYLQKHEEELNLSRRQDRQLSKSTSIIPPLNDAFIKIFGGLTQ